MINSNSSKLQLIVSNSKLISLIALSFFLTSCAPVLRPTSKHSTPPSGTATFDPGTIMETEERKTIPEPTLLERIAQVNVVYVGEQHTNSYSHDVQLKLIKHLANSGRTPSVGFELFREKHQALLDDWSRGNISLEEFKRHLETTGGNPEVVDYYRDVLKYARKRGLPLRALKPNRKTVRGLMKRNHGDTQSSHDSNLGPQARFLRELFREHPSTGRGFRSFVRVQQFWEGRMAENIHRHLSNADKPRSMVVLTGNLHVLYDFGIPDKLTDQENWFQLSIVTLPVNQSLEETFTHREQNREETVKPADYVWWVETSNKPRK